jgi:hypothetical protein
LQRGQECAWATPHSGQRRAPAGTGLAQRPQATLGVAPVVPGVGGLPGPGGRGERGSAGGVPPGLAVVAWLIACPIVYPRAMPAPRPAPAPATPPSLAAATGMDWAVWNCV